MTNRLPAQLVPTLLETSAAAHPNAPAISFLGRQWTYRALLAEVHRAAAGLQRLGVVRGTRVGLCLPNSPYSVIYFFAVLKAGGIVVNFNPLYVERELVHQITDSGTEIMVTIDLAMIYPKVLAAGVRTHLRKIIVCSMAGALPLAKSLLFRIAKRRDIATVHQDGRSVTHASLRRVRTRPSPVAGDAADIAVLQYTGGTTGIPKAASLSHANIVANAQQSALGIGGGPPGTERVLGVLPLFHVFALTSVMTTGVCIAAELILLPRFDLDQVLAVIAREKPTMFPAVPTIYSAIVAAAAKQKTDLSSIRLCMSGGAPLPAEVRQRFMALTGCWLMEGYGLSETSPVVCFTPPGTHYKDGSVGVPVAETVIEIRSVEDITRLLPAGERGEICIRGPQVMQGYWNRPKETADVMIDGALRTGDIGYLDEDGYLFIVDRIKDVIIAGGYNIYPRVLEEALYQHKAVKDAVVIGVPDAYRGQAPKAFVTLQEGAAATPAELRAFLEDYVSKIELPKEIEIRAELPKTTIGKLSKKELIAEEMARATCVSEPDTISARSG